MINVATADEFRMEYLRTFGSKFNSYLFNTTLADMRIIGKNGAKVEY